MKKVLLDVHTHTIASGHAYATITEMAQAANEIGLDILGITEHAKGIPGTCEDIYFANLEVLPRQFGRTKLLFGAEINILDYQGTLSLDQYHIDKLDIRIAGIHNFCYDFGTVEQNTNAVIKAIEHPSIDMISHPDDGNCPLNYEKVVVCAKNNHTLLEVNNNALRSSTRKNVVGNVLEMLRLCKKYQAEVILSSDAHYTTDIANMEHVNRVLQQAQFPEELILNYDTEKFLDWIKENRRREKQRERNIPKYHEE